MADSADVYNGLLASATSDPQYAAFCAFVAQLRESLPPCSTQHAAFRHQPVALFFDAKKAKDVYDKKLVEVGDATGARVITASLKSAQRAVEKVMLDYQGDWCRVTDIVRGSLVCSSISDLLRCLAYIVANGPDLGIRIGRVRNKFELSSEYAGVAYRDCSLKVQVQDGVGHVCELQLHLQAYFDRKKHGGHAVYRQARELGI